MLEYQTIVTIHILAAGIWLANLIVDSQLKKKIKSYSNLNEASNEIALYLNFSNWFGIISSMLILLTGILMVIQNPAYGFFEMTANHWLLSKQFIMVAILVITFALIIPSAKKVRSGIANNGTSEELNVSLKKAFLFNNIINIMVVINILFALSRRYFG